MAIGSVTTPFGRRRMTLALVKGQLEADGISPTKTVDKWRVYRDACDARTLLGLRDRALAVLNALLSFHPETQLSAEGGLIVFPSNDQLSIRANGIAGTTLRENLALLVDAGLISRKDSPNGKRYARKDRDGVIETAFGFSLAPLVARAEELARMAQAVAAERREVVCLREAISLHRRDIRKMLTAAMEEGARGDWTALEEQLVGILLAARNKKHPDDLRRVREELAGLHERVVKALKDQLLSNKSASNANENRQHIQNSKTESINELEPSPEPGLGAALADPPARPAEPTRSFPLSVVLRACPDMLDYGSGGEISSWRDMMSAAIVVRSTLGISPSAYQHACEVMGPENAATAMACILERGGHINSPGGYLRDLTRRAARGEFSVGPMVMALLRTRGASDRVAS